MAYTSKVICDSITPYGRRLISFENDYWRAIHSELLMHRGFNRSQSGSRAIPVEKVVERVERDPALPIFWAKNQKGMQAVEELSGGELLEAQRIWFDVRRHALNAATMLRNVGLHKQLANRILEPWMHIQNVITTGMEVLENFFMLRCHPDAQQETAHLAENMLTAVKNSRPLKLGWGEWHLPYLLPEERTASADIERRIRWSIARVARVSYMKHGNSKIDYADDEFLHDRLLAAGHMGPFEHQAQASQEAWRSCPSNLGPGWIQYRKTLPGEAVFQRNQRRDEIRAALYEV
jgi:hypothetical protein